MTSKEKAIHLCDMFYQKLPLERYVITTDGDLSWEYNNWKTAKECALIAVDNIINAINVNTGNAAQGRLIQSLNNYWQEVKSEIEKL